MHMGRFFSRGVEPPLPEKYFNSPKTAHLTSPKSMLSVS